MSNDSAISLLGISSKETLMFVCMYALLNLT